MMPLRPRMLSLLILCACIVMLPSQAGAAQPQRSFARKVQPTTYKPFVDAVQLQVPIELGNQTLAQIGLVDITASPFNADPTGQRDSTDAIQRAINFARDHQMVCYFPLGTYKISDTLNCQQLPYQRQNGVVLAAPRYPCVLVGSRAGGVNKIGDPVRPVILLAPNAPGYSKEGRPKYVVHFWAASMGQTGKPQPNISMNQQFIGIDIRIGQGNPGAVAIRHRCAEGSGIQDCTIDATHGLTGVEGGAGSGGAFINLKVIGGRYGLDLRQTQPATTVVGATLINQRQAAIISRGRESTVCVGIRIVSNHKGPVITTDGYWPWDGSLSLIDSQIEYTNGIGGGGGQVALQAKRGVVLQNVYLRGVASVIQHEDGVKLPGNPNGWIYVRRYARDEPKRTGTLRGEKMTFTGPIYQNGKPLSKGASIRQVTIGKAPDEDYVARHIPGNDFPSWQSTGAVNVKMAPYLAVGDGVHDDTAAIQRAIDTNRIVFLPKGYYRISRTIRLKADTQLVGIAQHLSVLLVRKAEGDFADDSNPQPILRTVDDPNGTTTVAFCGSVVGMDFSGAYAVQWRVGAQSIWRTVMATDQPMWGYGAAPPKGVRWRSQVPPWIVITGNGGGRWYVVGAGVNHFINPEFRKLLVKGTRQPLTIYQLHSQTARCDAISEITDSQNIRIYGLKGEGNNVILRIADSQNVSVYSYGGNAAALPGKSLFEIINSKDVLIANLWGHPRPTGARGGSAGQGVPPSKWFMLREKYKGAVIQTGSWERPTLYLRGDPR